MDERLLFPGGEINPTNTELNLMPDSNRGGINALCAGLAKGGPSPIDSYIVSGIDGFIIPGSITFSDGFVFLNGELLKVDAGVVVDTIGDSEYIFQKQVTDGGPDFVRNYRDGSINNVARISRAIIVPATSQQANSGNFLRVGPPLLVDTIRNFNARQIGFIEGIVIGESAVQDLTPNGDILTIDNYGTFETNRRSTFDVTWASPFPNNQYIVLFTFELTNTPSTIITKSANFTPVSGSRTTISLKQQAVGNFANTYNVHLVAVQL